MKHENEIKLRLPETLAGIRNKLRELGFRARRRRALETNILFDTPLHALGEQGKLIRIRRFHGRHILTFKGPSQKSRHKRRLEIEAVLPDAVTLERILKNLGYEPVFRYEKFRTEYSKKGAAGEVMLDETPVGNFLELEGSPRWIDATTRELGFSHGDQLTASYGSLYFTYCRTHGIRPKDMLFRSNRRRRR